MGNRALLLQWQAALTGTGTFRRRWHTVPVWWTVHLVRSGFATPLVDEVGAVVPGAHQLLHHPCPPAGEVGVPVVGRLDESVDDPVAAPCDRPWMRSVCDPRVGEPPPRWPALVPSHGRRGHRHREGSCRDLASAAPCARARRCRWRCRVRRHPGSPRTADGASTRWRAPRRCALRSSRASRWTGDCRIDPGWLACARGRR
jgi:hypothetical protein